MEIDKAMVLDLLRERGKSNEAAEAEKELPDRVDTDRDASLLERFGVNPSDLLGGLGTGGKGIPGF